MKKYAFLLIALCFFSCQKNSMEAEKEKIKKLTWEHILAVKNKDTAAYLSFHLPNKTTFKEEGGSLVEYQSLKEQGEIMQAEFDKGMDYQEDTSDIKVRIYGNTAIVTGKVVGNITQGGKIIEEFETNRTAVLVKQKGEWKEAHLHFSSFKPSPK